MDEQILSAQNQLEHTLTKLIENQKEITVHTTQLVTTRKELKKSTTANCANIQKLVDIQRKIIQTEELTTKTHQKLLEKLYESQTENKDTLPRLMGMQLTMINKNETINNLNHRLTKITELAAITETPKEPGYIEDLQQQRIRLQLTRKTLQT